MSNDDNLNSLADLQKELLDALKRVSKSELTPAAANACANLSGKIMQTFKIKMDYNKALGVPLIDTFITNPISPNSIEHIDRETGEVTKKKPKLTDTKKKKRRYEDDDEYEEAS
jgi:hypothetical protein